jgi:hypothetical protein
MRRFLECFVANEAKRRSMMRALAVACTLVLVILMCPLFPAAASVAVAADEAIPLVDCPRNERFVPDHTDDARACVFTKSSSCAPPAPPRLRCFESRHYPCAGVHTHGKLIYQEIRNSVCVQVVKPRAVRCDGPLEVVGECGSMSTVECREGGPQTSGIYEE